MKKLEWIVSLAFMTVGCASPEEPTPDTRTAKTAAAIEEDCYACESGPPPPVSYGSTASPPRTASGNQESSADFYDRCPTVSSESFEICPGYAYVKETKCCGDECITFNMGAQEAIDRCVMGS